MKYAISPVEADTGRHLRAIDSDESKRRANDELRDELTDQLEAGAELLAEAFDNGPEELRTEFFAVCLKLFTTTGADHLSGPLRELASPFQQVIAKVVADRADAEMQRRINAEQEFQAERKRA